MLLKNAKIYYASLVCSGAQFRASVIGTNHPNPKTLPTGIFMPFLKF